MADKIANLPKINDPPSETDSSAMKEIFKQTSKATSKIQWKKIIIPLVTFTLLSIPSLDRFFKDKISDSSVALILSKVAAFSVVLLILQFM